MAEEDRRLPRRWLVAAGVLMAIAAAVVAIAGPFDDDGAGAGTTPEAGSRFGSGDGERTQSLREALVPVVGRRDASRAARLTLEGAVAQLFVVGFDGRGQAEPVVDEVAERGWGGLLAGGARAAAPGNLRRVSTAAGEAARRAGRFEPVVAADPAVLGGIGPTPQLELSDASPAEVRRDAEEAGARLRAVGVRMVLHPSADLGVGGGPAELRAFGDDPDVVAPRVRAAVDGWIDADVLSVPGRFPGEGAASQDPLEGPATVGLSLDELAARDLKPFAAVAERAPAIQMSSAIYAAWDGVTPATLLPDAVALLRQRLAFDGAVVSADLVSATAATGDSIGAAAVQALKAGCDVLLVPGTREDREAAYRAVLDAVRRGTINRERIDQALMEMLSLKRRIGLAGS